MVFGGRGQAPSDDHLQGQGGNTEDDHDHDRARLDDETNAMSLKDMVELYAGEAGVSFVPKPGRQGPEGLPVYGFGNVTVAVDGKQKRILAFVEGRWVPASLDALLEEVGKRKPKK